MTPKSLKEIMHYFVQMFLPNGQVSRVAAITEQILISDEDPVLNMYANKVACKEKAIMVLWGLGQAASFMYENEKLKKMSQLQNDTD